MKKKSKSQKPVKVSDLEPKTAEPKGGAFDPAFLGGVRVATGDVNGDNIVAGNLIGTDGTGTTRKS